MMLPTHPRTNTTQIYKIGVINDISKYIKIDRVNRSTTQFSWEETISLKSPEINQGKINITAKSTKNIPQLHANSKTRASI